MLKRIVVGLVVLGALAPLRHARAEKTPTGAPEKPLTLVDKCMAEGDRLLDQTRVERELWMRLSLAQQAKTICEEARKSALDDPKPLLMLARAELISDPAHPEQCLPGSCEKALGLLGQARQLDRTREHAPRIAFDIAMVHSRMGRFEAAVAEYDLAMRFVGDMRAWDRWFDAFDDAMLWGNSAESLMALGRLEESVVRYRRAVAAAPPGSLGWALGLWGLGVALDRDGQVELARKAIRQVLDLDPAMGRLFSDGVFFEPPGDIWYYTGLGHEVAGDLYRASEHFKRFLAEAPKSQYAASGRRHVRELERERLLRGPSGAIAIAGASGDPDKWVEQVRGQFERHLPELQLCYDRVLQKMPNARGMARFLITYSETGVGVDVQPRPGPLTEGFVRCALITMWAWRFDYVGGTHPEAAIIVELGGKR